MKKIQIEFRMKNGQSCKFLSTVSGGFYTLYQVTGERRSDLSQHVLAYYNKETIFVNMSKMSPVLLYWCCYKSAVISIKDWVITITNSVYKSLSSEVEYLSLSGCEKAVKAAWSKKKKVNIFCESRMVIEWHSFWKCF